MGTLGIICFFYSLIATLSTICFIFYKRIHTNIQVKPLLHLMIADFFLAFAWVSSSAAYLERNDIETVQQTSVSCFIWQLITEVSLAN